MYELQFNLKVWSSELEFEGCLIRAATRHYVSAFKLYYGNVDDFLAHFKSENINGSTYFGRFIMSYAFISRYVMYQQVCIQLEFGK